MNEFEKDFKLQRIDLRLVLLKSEKDLNFVTDRACVKARKSYLKR
jgi:hypothetical protein